MDSDNSYHVVRAASVGGASVLDGFTITGGYADGAGLDACGGGVLDTGGSCVLVGCVLEGNYAGSSGGGMYIGAGSEPVLMNCVLVGNSSGNMGGALGTAEDVSSPVVFDCVINGNGAVMGGGVYNDMSMAVVNCTIVNNTAVGTGGGVYDAGDGLLLANSIVWGNVTDAIGGGASAVVTHCDVEGGFGGNLSVEPLFKDADGVDDIAGNRDDMFELSQESVCIDAGDNTLVPTDVADIDGDGDVGEKVGLDFYGRVRFTDDPLSSDVGVGGGGYSAIVDMGVSERYEFCGDAGHAHPTMDFNHDCVVDLLDFAEFCGQWLDSSRPE